MTASRYLDALIKTGFLAKPKIGRGNYSVNLVLNPILLVQHTGFQLGAA